MIKVRNITKIYKDKKVLNSFSYKFNKKGLYIVSGASGSGKSTLLNILSGNDKLFKGCLGIGGEVFYLKDKGNLITSLSVKDNFYLFELVNNKKVNYYFDIKDMLNKKVSKLSLGELQLVQLILVLNSESEIVIMDEPFSALEESNLEMCSELVERLSKEKLIIVATHNASKFNNFKIIDLDNKKKHKIKNFKSYNFNKKKKLKKEHYFFYLKKSFFNKLMFVISIFLTIFSFFYVNKYSNNLGYEYLKEFASGDGTLVRKNSEIKSMRDNVFYEVCKELANYIVNYNANYFDVSLYDYDVEVNGYYIDNGITLSSFQYIERYLKDNEIVLGLNYKNFCRRNHLFNCEESYLKTLLINKKLEGFDLYVKDIVYSESTSFYKNERFYNLVDSSYAEYYLDVKKENINQIYYLINSDDFLTNFEFIQIGENEEMIRYRVNVMDYKRINGFDYDKYIVCLDKGYNCDNYLSHFQSLVRIDDSYDGLDLSLGLYDQYLNLDEIVISSKLSLFLDKSVGDYVDLYFEYEGEVIKKSLKIKSVVKEDIFCLYHNSNWSYSFYKDVIGFKNKDLMINKVIVYEGVKEGYVQVNDAYKEVLEQLDEMFSRIKKTAFTLNVIVTCSSLFILILLEVFHNKFKKEYFSYLKLLNVEKKNA